MKILLLCFFSILTINTYAQNAYTPEKGSADRNEILDIFREDFATEKNKILFKVSHFLISGNWACAYVIPLKNNVEYGEPRWDLFNKSGGKWKSVEWSTGIQFQDDFELIDLPIQNKRIARLIIKKYPSCPMSIFGK